MHKKDDKAQEGFFQSGLPGLILNTRRTEKGKKCSTFSRPLKHSESISGRKDATPTHKASGLKDVAGETKEL